MSTVDQRIQNHPMTGAIIARYPQYADLRDRQRIREGTPRTSLSYPVVEGKVAHLVYELLSQPKAQRPYGATNAITIILGISRQAISALLERHHHNLHPIQEAPPEPGDLMLYARARSSKGPARKSVHRDGCTAAPDGPDWFSSGPHDDVDHVNRWIDAASVPVSTSCPRCGGLS